MAEDVRIIKNKRNIEDTFIKILKKKDFSHITIKDICDSSLISRSTFYSHYLDKYDLLEKIVQRFTNIFEQTAKQRFFISSNNDFETLLNEMVGFYLQYQEELRVLLNVHIPNGDLSKEIENILFKQCQFFIQDKNKSTIIPTDLIAKLYAANVFVLINWVLERGETDEQSLHMVNELQNTIFKIVSG